MLMQREERGLWRRSKGGRINYDIKALGSPFFRDSQMSKCLRIKEFCDISDVKLYCHELEIAIKLAGDMGFSVGTRYDCIQSTTIWASRCILISLKEGAAKGLDLIWDLLHEIGHVRDGDPGCHLSCQEKIRREISAWRNGWDLVESHFPTLSIFYERYCIRKYHCLDTYVRFLQANCDR